MVTFEQFVETCVSELVDEDHSVEHITGQLTSLKTKYEKSPIWKNKALEQILAHYDHSIKSETELNGKQLVFYDFKEEFKRLDKYLNTLKSKDKKERTKLMKKIKDLQTRMKKDLRKIDRLDQSEISLDDLDNENSDHMKKYKYEQRLKRFSSKLLRLQGAKESARLLDKVYKYSGTSYPELNEAISLKYRAIMQKKYKGKIPQRPINSTPSIADITELIENFCSERKTIIPNKSELAFKITSDVIKEVQRRRELELHEMMNDYEHDSHLRPTSVPDLADEELNRRLVSNEEKCRDSFIKKRDELKKKLDDGESGDIGGEEGTASEEDEEDEEDEDDIIDDGINEDEDEEISEDEVMEASEANPEDDEDDDPILLDEAGTTVNGEAQASEASSSNENKKRSFNTNGTETSGDEPSKKVKIESQMKTESKSEVKEKTSSIDEKNGEVETKEEQKGQKGQKEEKVEEAAPEEIKEKTQEKKNSSEDQIIKISNESEEVVKEESAKKSEEPTINNQSKDKPTSSSPSIETDLPKVAATESEVKTDSNQPKSTKPESDHGIKIVDLEEENRPLDDQSNNFDDDDDDDDDVICLD